MSAVLAQPASSPALTTGIGCPSVRLGLLGGFRLLKHDRPLEVRHGGKTERLLTSLALRSRHGIDREELLGLVWPASDETLAAQSLHTLTHALRQALSDALGGHSPIVRRGGRLCLNLEDGITVDVAEFESAAASGDMLRRAGDDTAAALAYQAAAEIYRGDLVIGSDLRELLERERLRTRYLAVLANLAESHFIRGDYPAAQSQALILLTNDPCREDAHRVVMRCHVRLGQRAQALRQFVMCVEILSREFGASPEPETAQLYEQIRIQPQTV